MKKNVLFWIGVKSESKLMLEKHGNFDYLNISKAAWKYWCEKNDVIFFEYDSTSEKDTEKHRVTWTRWFDVFDQIEEAGIDYDKIALMDGNCIVKWDAPNFFNLVSGDLTAFRALENLQWVYEAIEGYKELFDNYELDITKYISCGFQIFNKKHKQFLSELKDFYYKNNEDILRLQKDVHRGTDQTPYNYFLQIKNIKVDSLPLPYMLTHIGRFDLFSHNWQLNEDKTPFFIKYGYLWFFSGFDRALRNDLMGQVWDLIKHNYDKNHFLNRSTNKDEWVKTTTRRFKEDILRIFNGRKDLICLELGSCNGDTTRVLAECFKKVYAFDMTDENVESVKNRCYDVDNVIVDKKDVYTSDFKIPDDNIDVTFVDAGHATELIKFDINRLLNKNKNMILIFDDYGHPSGVIKNAIHDSNISIDRYIGENAGFVCKNGKIKFVTREGVICNMG